MYRAMIFVGALLSVAAILLFAQPKPSHPHDPDVIALQETDVAGPAVRPAPVGSGTLDVPQLTNRIVPASPVDGSSVDAGGTFAAAAPSVATPQNPVDTTGQPAVTRALNTPVLATGDEAPLFGALAQERPRLLTTTVRQADGTLQPSLGAATSQGFDQDIGNALAEPASRSAQTPLSAAPDEIEVPAAVPPSPVPVSAEPPSIEMTEAMRTAIISAPIRTVHTVRFGDSLEGLAERYYEDPGKAQFIVEANRRLFRDGESVSVGQLLRIPDISGL